MALNEKDTERILRTAGWGDLANGIIYGSLVLLCIWQVFFGESPVFFGLLGAGCMAVSAFSLRDAIRAIRQQGKTSNHGGEQQP